MSNILIGDSWWVQFGQFMGLFIIYLIVQLMKKMDMGANK